MVKLCVEPVLDASKLLFDFVTFINGVIAESSAQNKTAIGIADMYFTATKYINAALRRYINAFNTRQHIAQKRHDLQPHRMHITPATCLQEEGFGTRKSRNYC